MMFYKKLRLLTVGVTVMVWQECFATDDDMAYPENLSPSLTFASMKQNQTPFWGGVNLDDSFKVVFQFLPSQGILNFLSTNRGFRGNLTLWKRFSSLQGVTISDASKTGDDVRGEMRDGMLANFRKEILDMDPQELWGKSADKPSKLGIFLEKAHKLPFTWVVLIDVLPGIFKLKQDDMLQELLSEEFFSNTSRQLIYSYVDALAQQRDDKGMPVIGSDYAQYALVVEAVFGRIPFQDKPLEVRYHYVKTIAEHKNPDGTSGPGSKYAQECLIANAGKGEVFFKNTSVEERYEYLCKGSGRKDSRGMPARIAEYAQEELNRWAVEGIGLFQSKSLKERRAYLSEISLRKNPDDTPGVGAHDAQRWMIWSAVDGNRVFEDLSASARRQYLEETAARKNLDDMTEYAQNMLIYEALYENAHALFDDKERFSYLVGVTERKRHNNLPIVSERTLTSIMQCAFDGRGVFKSVSFLERRGYLEEVFKRGAMGAEKAQKFLNEMPRDS